MKAPRPISKKRLDRITEECLQPIHNAMHRLTGPQQVQVLDSLMQSIVNRINWLRDVYKLNGPIHPRLAQEQLSCSICHTRMDGMGNNARPVNEGRCCNYCNSMEVIPARLELARRHR